MIPLIVLPKDLSERVARVWGRKGQLWVENFPAILAHIRDSWKLGDITPLPQLSYNFVASTATSAGQPVILKLGVPNPELTTEAAALRAYNGRGSVRLISADLEKGALLLEMLNPGRMLHTVGDNRTESEIAAKVMAKLCAPPPKDHQFPSMIDWIKAFSRVLADHQPEEAGLPTRLIETAQTLVDDLTRTAPDEWLLHGDLHHYNILEDAKRGWIAIDPKGVIGEKAYQAARYFSNPNSEFNILPDPVGITRQRVEIISRELEVGPERLLMWAFVDCILGACWSIEDNEKEGVRNAVSAAEVFAQVINI